MKLSQHEQRSPPQASAHLSRGGLRLSDVDGVEQPVRIRDDFPRLAHAATLVLAVNTKPRVAMSPGQFIRLPLRLIPKGAVLPILSGPNRGYRWVSGSFNHGCWIGWYDRATQVRLVGSLRPGDVAYDIGANAGFFTLLMARCVGPSGHVHAFEPLPENVAALRRHLAINDVRNVTVHPVAVSDRTGTATFCRGNSKAQGFLSHAGTLIVQCVAIDDLGLPLPRTVKMDIEGGESLALCGMVRTLREARPYLLIEGHI